MEKARFQRLEALFAEAADLPVDRIDAFINSHCDDDAELAQQLRKMITLDTKATGQVLSVVDESAAESKLIGQKIGAYRIDGVLGSGAMGIVYQARRADGAYEQEVALKLIASRFANADVRARFLRERQVLATLQHPGIARLLDGGLTEDDTPYLVMECVTGKPITQYCDEHDLDVDARLDLFSKVCDAIQHAHVNLIVHRDLKPAHMLVDSNGHVMLLDFGIAAVLDSAEVSDTTLTQFRRFTPQYASPEQLTGGTVTTATDVYALGVVLYQLLGGVLPYEVSSGASDAERRLICETIPVAPSAAVELSQQPDAKRLRRKLRGDLDTIVMTALRKEPVRRYGSADALLQDLRRYRQGLPVAAQRDTFMYRAQKFVQRHKLPVVAAALASLSLIVGTWVSVNFAIDAKQKSQELSLALERSEETREFLTSIFDAASPGQDAAEMTARQILDAGLARIRADLNGQPKLQVDLLETMAEVYGGLGTPNEWRDVLEFERELRLELDGAHTDAYTNVLLRLSEAEDLNGNNDRAFELANEALALSQSSGNLVHEAGAQLRIGRTQHIWGNFQKAEVGYRAGLTILEAESDPMSWAVAEAKLFLGTLLNEQEEHEAAYELLSESLSVYLDLGLDQENPRTDLPLALAGSMHALDRSDDAIVLLRDTRLTNDKWYGPDNVYNQYVVNLMGKFELERGEFESATGYFEEVMRLISIHAPDNPGRAFPLAYLGEAHMSTGQCDAALPILEQSEKIFQQKLSEHWYIGVTQSHIGRCLTDARRYDEAEPLVLKGLATIEAKRGRDHEATAAAYRAAYDLYIAWGRPETALSFSTKATKGL